MASFAPEVDSAALSAPLDGSDAQAPAGAAGAPVPADAPAKPSKKTGGKRKAAAAAPDGKADLPLSKDEPQDELQPLPEEASGFRKRQKKDGYVPVRSSSIPGMTVGDIRKSLNQIRKAGDSIQSNHLLWNGWAAGRFALAYTLGNHAKRATKGKDQEEEEGEGEGEAEATA